VRGPLRPSLVASAIIAGAVLVAGVVLLLTDGGVEILGPVLVYSVATAIVVALLLRPGRRSGR